MLNFFRGQRASFGLDISDLSLKLVQLSEKNRQKSVQAYADCHLPKEVLHGDQVKDRTALVRAIQKTVGAPNYGKITTSYVVASIPETKSFVRLIQMPVMSDEEITEAIQYEAEAYIPMPINQVYLDWASINDPRAQGQEKMTIQISASPRDYIDGLVKILIEAGLKPLALEVESEATARSTVAESQLKECALIADIDALRTSLIIKQQGVLQFTSSLPIGGNSFTESLVRATNLDFDAAEKLKREVGIGGSGKAAKVKKALTPVLNNLLEEILNTIKFHDEHSRSECKISRLILLGGGSKLPHLPSFLQEKLSRIETGDRFFRSVPGIKVELGNPWVNILTKGQTPPMSRQESLSYATAIGLALWEKNIP